jgi:hypothetical protein
MNLELYNDLMTGRGVVEVELRCAQGSHDSIENTDCKENEMVRYWNFTSSDKTNGSVHPMEFFGIFSKLGTNRCSFLKLLLKAVGSAGGTTHQKDMHVDTMEEAVVSLKEMIESAKEKGSASQWSFQTAPFEEFKQSLDDLLVVFLNWAATDGAPNDRTKWSREGSVNGRHETINASKAFFDGWKIMRNGWTMSTWWWTPHWLQILSRKFGRPLRRKLSTATAIVGTVPLTLSSSKGADHYATGRKADSA